MNNQFDEFTKSMAQSVTRRAALKKFGVGLAGMALAFFGLANKAEAVDTKACYARCADLCRTKYPTLPANGPCYRACALKCKGV